MRRTIEHGDLEIEIDGWGGLHFDFAECDDIEEALSLSPLIAKEIEDKRNAVLEEQFDDEENTDD